MLCLPQCKNDDNGDNGSPPTTPPPPTTTPEPTCTPGDTEILTAELTVGTCTLGDPLLPTTSGAYGLEDGGFCPSDIGAIGMLDIASFNTLDGENHTIADIVYFVGAISGLSLGLRGDRQIPSESNLTLDLGGTMFSLSEAWAKASYVWFSHGLDWTTTTTVDVKIIESVTCP